LAVGVLLVLYLVFLNYTDQKVPENMDDLKESLSNSAKKVKTAASESLEDVKESAKKIVEEKVEEKVDKVFGK